MNKFFRILLILTFITSCSLDNKTGIWSPKEKIKKEAKKEKKLNTKKELFTEEIAFKNELNPKLLIRLKEKPRKNSLVNKVIGDDYSKIKSTHHQGIRTLGSGLKPVSWSDDGLIEAIEDTKVPNAFLAVQWHPELMLDDESQINLFKWLVKESQSRN